MKNTNYVAVVHKYGEMSGRHDGDWASFLSKDKKIAIAKAMVARKRWESKGYGPYQIWVGTLTESLNVPQPTYALERIDES